HHHSSSSASTSSSSSSSSLSFSHHGKKGYFQPDGSISYASLLRKLFIPEKLDCSEDEEEED
ncbi:hypothetical protein CSUI_006638, partial [Cystoisospora suis]